MQQPPPWAPTLRAEGVTLRPHRPEDYEGVIAQCRDQLTQRWTTVPIPYERRDAQAWLEGREREWLSGRYLAFAVEADGRFAGTVDLRPDGEGAAQVGYGLGPWARGHGITTRALRLLLPWGFQTLGLDVIHWTALAGNWASRRVAWSVGFRMDGSVRGLLFDRDRRADGWIGSLRREDRLWPAHPWHVPPVLPGERVVLRPHRTADIPAITQACADPLTQHWLTLLPRPYLEDDARQHLDDMAEEQASGQAIYWAVADPATERLIAEVGVFGLNRGHARAGEVGYWAHPVARGLGMTTQAVRVASRHALLPRDVGGLGLDRLLIRAAAGNLASQRVAISAGFQPAGRDRQAQLRRDGTLDDLLRFDLLAAELTTPLPGRRGAPARQVWQ